MEEEPVVQERFARGFAKVAKVRQRRRPSIR
jgi:hypothetical protein